MLHVMSCRVAGSTAAHSVEHGFRTILIEDACRGVSLEDIEGTRQRLLRSGASIVDASEVRIFSPTYYGLLMFLKMLCIINSCVVLFIKRL